MKKRFLVYSYSTDNIGDDIQSLAALRFLPEDQVTFLDRDRIGRFRWFRYHLIANGWYMHDLVYKYRVRYRSHVKKPIGTEPPALRTSLKSLAKKCLTQKFLRSFLYSWPPSRRILPLLISVHILPELKAQFLTRRSIAFFKKHAPVGCRDTYTQSLLESAGIPSYYSQCLTLTLENPFGENVKREGIVLVDIPETVKVPKALQSQVQRITHTTRLRRTSERMKHAEELLQMYARASLVLTTRIHCALPCVAFGTPVIFFYEDAEDPRIKDMIPLFNSYPLDEMEKVLAALAAGKTYSNPPRPEAAIEDMRRRCYNFVKSVQDTHTRMRGPASRVRS